MDQDTRNEKTETNFFSQEQFILLIVHKYNTSVSEK